MAGEPGDNADATEIILFQEETSRAVAFGRMGTIVGLVGLALLAVPQLTLTARERGATIACVAVLTAVCATTWYRAGKNLRYAVPLARSLAAAGTIALLVLVYELGVFTPIAVLLMLGLVFGQRDKYITFFVPRVLAFSYIALTILVTAGVLPDGGIWRERGFQQHIGMTLIVGAILLMQTSFHRASRRALAEAVARSHEMARVVRTREAQLEEVRENLNVALRRGAAGRMTGRSVGGYRLGDIIGRGAMGEVYVASLEAGGRAAAIKVLLAPEDDDVAQRFVREAEIALKVRGPNLVDVFGVGRFDDGPLYIAMELLEGRDLAAILRERQTLSLGEVVDLVDAIARGLEVLHAAGVIHRDLKPQNIFLSSRDERSEWKVLDYGVSKLLGAGTLTRGEIVGTPAFMAPEQAVGDEVDRRSDVFSLAAVAYRALTGRRPFGGTEMPQILFQLVHGKPTPAREVDPSISREVEAVLMSALSRAPDDRYATAQELATALRGASHAAPEDDLDGPTIVTTDATGVRPSASRVPTEQRKTS